MSIETIQDDFTFLDDWEDRYRYVIELGRGLKPLADDLRTDANKVRGCASQVWLSTTVEPDADPAGASMHFEGDSDAMIVRGLIAILFAIYEGKTAAEILSTDTDAIFAGLGLAEHLTQQRSNGLASMVARIKADALHIVAGASASRPS